MKLDLTVGIFFTLFIGPLALANDIVCRNTESNQVTMRFHSENPIPNYSFESFKSHSSYGTLFIHGKDRGSTWMNVENAGVGLYYEIKLQDALSKPTAHIHLTFDKSGIFNGYLQNNNAVSENLEMELLSCTFETLNSH